MPVESTPFGDQPNASIWNDGVNIQTPCQNIFYNRYIGDYFYKECPTGQVGSGKWFEVAAGTFASEISQEDADALAEAYLEEQGQSLADLEGVCELGDFTEVFTSMQSAVNWDWLADKNDPASTPFYAKAYKQAGAYTVLPLINILWYLGETGALFPSTEQIYVPFDIHDEHGLMHIDFSSVSPNRPNLLGTNWVTTGQLAGNLIPFQTYGGFLIADFGSEEIWGDNAVTLGGMLGIIETTASYSQVFSAHPDDTTKAGHFNGYIIAYNAEGINVYKWNPSLKDYEVKGNVPFDMQNKTVYFGYGIRYDQGQWAAELYLNGAWQLSIFDDDIVSFTMFRYQRGVLSMDYWFGDWIIGSMSPFVNRTPPALHVRNFAPKEFYFDWPADDLTPEWYDRPANYIDMVPQGDALTAAEAVDGPVKLRTLEQQGDLGFEVEVPGTVGFQFPVAQWGVRWDPNDWDAPYLGQQERVFGCCPFFTYRWSKQHIAPFPYGMNRVYEGVFTSDDELYFFTIPSAQFPAIIPYVSIFEDDPYNDLAFLAPTRAKCYPTGYDRPLVKEDMLEPYTWATMEHQTFVFNGQLYTKDFIADHWIYFYLNPQAEENVDEPTVFKFHMPYLRMFSGVRGLRTRKTLEAPTYEVPNCPYPTCTNNQRYFLAVGSFVDEGGGVLKSDALLQCDNLFPLAGIPGDEQIQSNGWHWNVTVQDKLDAGKRIITVTLSSIATELMGYLLASSQLAHVPIDPVRLRVWRPDWPLPVWDSDAVIENVNINVPPAPPGQIVGMPPEVTIMYIVAPTTYEYDQTLPLFAEPGVAFQFELLPT